MACWIMGSVTAPPRSSVMILLMPISSPWSMTMSAISEAVYSESSMGAVRCSSMGCFFEVCTS